MVAPVVRWNTAARQFTEEAATECLFCFRSHGLALREFALSQELLQIKAWFVFICRFSQILRKDFKSADNFGNIFSYNFRITPNIKIPCFQEIKTGAKIFTRSIFYSESNTCAHIKSNFLRSPNSIGYKISQMARVKCFEEQRCCNSNRI